MFSLTVIMVACFSCSVVGGICGWKCAKIAYNVDGRYGDTHAENGGLDES